MEKLVLENEYKIAMPLFGAAFAPPNKGTTFYTDVGLYQKCQVLQKIEFRDFSRPNSDFPILFKADLIYKDFSRKPSKFKYFFKPVRTLKSHNQNEVGIRYSNIMGVTIRALLK